MVIQVGEIKMNKTIDFLVPILKVYGKEFGDKINLLTKLAIGIGDMLLGKKGIRYEQHLFILVDTKKTGKKFGSFLKWIKVLPMYEDDYAFDSVKDGHMHMIVIKVPEEMYKATENFKHGQFSRMYTPTEVQDLFPEGKVSTKIISKDHNYKVQFVGKLNELFNMTGEHALTPDDYDGELELPINKQDEYFD
jgi:hypothetical protein